jgi:small subunit ribosomal protein S16
MPVKIRLTRMGKKKQPSYRVVVMDSRKPRDGKYIEQIGRYDAREDPSLIEINNERAVEWLQQGAQPTDRAKKLLEISGAWTEFKVARGEIHTVGEKPEKPPVDAAPVMLDDIREEVEEAVDADDVTEVEEAADAIEAAGAAADDTIEITTVEDTDATETDEA